MYQSRSGALIRKNPVLVLRESNEEGFVIRLSSGAVFDGTHIFVAFRIDSTEDCSELAHFQVFLGRIPESMFVGQRGRFNDWIKLPSRWTRVSFSDRPAPRPPFTGA